MSEASAVTTTDTTTETITWEQTESGVVVLTFDDPTQSVNTMTAAWSASLSAALDRLAALGPDLTGVILTSAKKTFFAGGDLGDLLATTPEQAGELTVFADGAKAMLRRLETLGVPVVAALGGSALGGGYEIALACHHRIAVDSPALRIGLPEVTLGLLPGGGGVVRTVRLLGLDVALDKVLLPGTAYRVQDALDLGLIDRIVPDADSLIAAATQWISANPGATQPWDRGEPIPGGTAYTPAIEAVLPLRSAVLRTRHKGAPMPAPANILAAAVESTQVDFDTASAVETRYFVELATGPISKNIIQGTLLRQADHQVRREPPGGFPRPPRELRRRSRCRHDGRRRGPVMRTRGNAAWRSRTSTSQPRNVARTMPARCWASRSRPASAPERTPTRSWTSSPRPHRSPTSPAPTW